MIKNPKINTYVFFAGRCEEALEFYKTAIGAKVEMLMRFNESPDKSALNHIQAGFENKVMHSAFWVNDTLILASDGCNEDAGFKGFSLVLNVENEAEADRAFAALSDGGKVKMPLSKTFWSPRYGMLQDRFGVEWMVMVPGESP